MFKYMFSFFDSFVSRLAILLTKAGTCLTWQGLLSKHNQVLAVLLRDSRDTDIHSVRSLWHFRLTCITLHLLVLPFGVSANNQVRLAVANGRICERRVKSYVMRRKNFLFHDAVDGTNASAIVLSLIETAKSNNLNIYQYLYTLLLYMPDYKNEPAGIEQLMP